MTFFEPRILVAEDDAVLAAVFEDLLPTYGIGVDVFSNAEDALEALQATEYHLVLADKNLPGRDGLFLLRQVKEMDEELDVILMTAFVDMPSILEALQEGAYDYLIKPFKDMDEVITKIRRAFEKRLVVLEKRVLVDHLTQANEKIEAMNKELEQRVKERTAQLSRANERLEQLSLTDDVTGLYNQRFLFERLENEFSRAQRQGYPLALMMLDLDHFKQVNDNHDHLFGSRVLKRIGHVLTEGCRRGDMVIRYGGDEFCLILPHTTLNAAIMVGERLRGDVERTDFGDDDHSCRVSVSIGVASSHGAKAKSARELLRMADKALYEAKHSGRNQIAAFEGDGPRSVVSALR